MKITNRTRAALTMLVILARKKEVKCSTLAEEAKISISCAEQMMSLLRAAGIVAAQRGPGGGYSLARPTHAITIGDIIETVENWTPVKADEWALVTNEFWRCANKIMLKSVL